MLSDLMYVGVGKKLWEVRIEVGSWWKGEGQLKYAKMAGLASFLYLIEAHKRVPSATACASD